MSNDDDLVKAMRSGLDDLVAGVPDQPTSPPPWPASNGDPPSRRRVMPIAVAAVSLAVLVGGLIVIANRDTDEQRSDAPTGSGPATTPPATTQVEPVPATTYVVTDPDAQHYETVATVLESAEHGPELCLAGVAESYPPQCSGLPLAGWSWDVLEGEQSANGTTWGEAYVAGTWDPAAHVFTVTSARIAEDADRERLQVAAQPDFSVPCPAPEGGWPARNQEWPGEQISAIEGYAGAWVDESQQVMTVKFTGDLEAAEAAVRQYYSDALCVRPRRSHRSGTAPDPRPADGDEQRPVPVELGVSSTPPGNGWRSSAIAPDPERQAAFDAEWGPGVVRLVSQLHPM